MKYIRAFFDFWRKFIVGDDSRIAIVIMWSMLFVDSLSLNFIHGWFVIPVVIVLFMMKILYDESVQKSKVIHISVWQQLLLSAVLPMFLVIALPPVLFRIINDTMGWTTVFLPVCIYVVITVVCSALATKSYEKFPVLTLAVLGCVAFVVINYGEPYVTHIAQMIS